MSAATADVVAILVVHNNAAVLSRCLSALAAAAVGVSARALVIDSGSSDESGEVCARHGVRCVPVANRGMGAAVNRALTSDEVRAARYVLQLNPDVEMVPGSLDTLVAYADATPRCGVVAPRQVDQNNELIHSIGLEPTVARYWRASNPLVDDWNWVRDPERYRRPSSVDWVMGACLLLRREPLDEIGGYDERFFLSSEEVDLCRRARQAGWSVDYLPQVTVMHPLADRPLDHHRVKLEEWSRIVYLRKWHSWPARSLMRLAMIIRFARLAALERHQPRQGQCHAIRLATVLRPWWRGYGPA